MSDLPRRNRRIRVMVDTNVALNYALGNEVAVDEIRCFLNTCADKDIDVLLTATSLKDMFYIMPRAYRRQLSPNSVDLPQHELDALIRDVSWHAICDAMALYGIVGVDQDVCESAVGLRRHHPDFEDNLVMSAADSVSAKYVVTYDEQLIKHFPGICMTPKHVLAWLG